MISALSLQRLYGHATTALRPGDGQTLADGQLDCLMRNAAARPSSQQLVDRLLLHGTPAAAPLDGKAWCASATTAQPVATFFDGFMRCKRYHVDVSDSAAGVDVNGLRAKGDNCTLVAAIATTKDGPPQVILKGHDARMPRQVRGEPYILTGFIGGRWDHADTSGPMIGMAEIGEEVGGKALEGGYWALGQSMSPTMPYESTESDMYRGAVIRLGGEAAGDGGGMELDGVMGPAVMPYQQAFEAMQNGEVADGARASVMYHRLFDSIGFVPQLGVYAQDRRELAPHFDRLGLEAGPEVRSLEREVEVEHKAPPPGPVDAEKAAVDRAAFITRRDIDIGGGATFVDAVTAHATPTGQTVGKSFPNQMLLLGYDRAKVAVYYVDARHGPMVHLGPTARPLMAAKALSHDGASNGSDENNNLTVLDVPEIKLSRQGSAGEQVAGVLRQAGIDERPVELGAKTGASTGQSDLYYHFYAVQVQPQPDNHDFVPLSDAIAACRAGEGDTQTEGLLERLAGQTKWVPTLRMYETDARRVLSEN